MFVINNTKNVTLIIYTINICSFIKFDDLYKLHNVKESIVVSRPTVQSPGYGLDGLNESEYIDYNEGKVIWKKDFYQPKQKMDFFINKYNLKF